MIESLLREGGEGLVVLPRLDAAPDSQEFLEPLLSERRARLLGRETLLLNGAEMECRRFEYIGERYDESAGFWLDSGGLLQRYRWREATDKLWEVTLVPGD